MVLNLMCMDCHFNPLCTDGRTSQELGKQCTYELCCLCYTSSIIIQQNSQRVWLFVDSFFRELCNKSLQLSTFNFFFALKHASGDFISLCIMTNLFISVIYLDSVVNLDLVFVKYI
jgi:hypothetical protein